MSISAIGAPSRRIGTTISARVLRRARAGPRSEDEFRPFDRIDADPGVVRDLSQFAADEIRDRLPLTPGEDDVLKARGDVVVTHLPLLAGHDLAELPDAFHGDRRRVE